MASWISLTVLGSMPAKGSSSMINLGLVISDRAISGARTGARRLETRLALVLRICCQAELVQEPVLAIDPLAAIERDESGGSPSGYFRPRAV